MKLKKLRIYWEPYTKNTPWKFKWLQFNYHVEKCGCIFITLGPLFIDWRRCK